MTRVELFKWSADYSVGVHLFDQQHQRLINRINELHDAALAGGSQMASEHALMELIVYVKTHFAAEERVLREHGYPEYDRHKQEHDKMTVRVLGFQKEVAGGRPVTSLNLSSVLAEWLRTHILETDKRYAAFLAERGVK